MPAFELLFLYMDNGRLAGGRPQHDDPAPWIKRARDELLVARSANVNFDGDKGDGWSLTFENFMTAGVTTWKFRQQIRAVSLVSTGASEAVDADAFRLFLKSCAGFIDTVAFSKSLDLIKRPAVIQLGTDRNVFATRLVNTISIAIARAVFEKLNLAKKTIPLSAEPLHPRAAIFAMQTYTSEGLPLIPQKKKVASGIDRLNHHLVEFFAGGLRGEHRGFDFNVIIYDQRLMMMWQPFGKTAGVVMMYDPPPADEPSETLLLLTGLDHVDDRAAIEAYKLQLAIRGISTAWSNVFNKIKSSSRPLLVRFLSRGTNPSGAGERAALCFAEAFFESKKVM